MKNKSTKHALLASVLSIVMCFAMLIGSTFAWFTDEVKSGVNKIQAGNLDVGLEMKDAEGNWVDAEGKELGWVAADGRAQDQILWEPGATYKLSDIRIVNKGNLALKYKIIINGVDGDAKLLEAIKFTYGDFDVTAEGYLLPGETSDVITITGHMDELAGNDYMGLTIDGLGITVIAGQYTYEQDSTDDQYDKNAEYPPIEVTENSKAWYDDHATDSNFTIKTGNELAYLAELVNAGTDDFAGKNITLANDIVLPNGEWVAIGTYEKPFKGIFDGAGHTVSNIVIHDNNGDQPCGFFGKIENATVTGLRVEGKMTLDAIQNEFGNKAVLCGNGGICGYANASTITKCTNAMSIDASARTIPAELSAVPVGGIVGVAPNSTVENCLNVGNIIGAVDSPTGGIASGLHIMGGTNPTTIKNCVNAGEVKPTTTTEMPAGAIALYWYDGFYANCYSVNGEILGYNAEDGSPINTDNTSYNLDDSIWNLTGSYPTLK